MPHTPSKLAHQINLSREPNLILPFDGKGFYVEKHGYNDLLSLSCLKHRECSSTELRGAIMENHDREDGSVSPFDSFI